MSEEKEEVMYSMSAHPKYGEVICDQRGSATTTKREMSASQTLKSLIHATVAWDVM